MAFFCNKLSIHQHQIFILYGYMHLGVWDAQLLSQVNLFSISPVIPCGIVKKYMEHMEFSLGKFELAAIIAGGLKPFLHCSTVEMYR